MQEHEDRTPGTTDAVESATEQSRERAGGGRDADVAHRPGEGPPVETDPAEEQPAIDGAAADAGPGDAPEGATPTVPRRSGDPLADAHGPD
jgi:hypothetical protein